MLFTIGKLKKEFRDFKKSNGYNGETFEQFVRACGFKMSNKTRLLVSYEEKLTKAKRNFTRLQNAKKSGELYKKIMLDMYQREIDFNQKMVNFLRTKNSNRRRLIKFGNRAL